MCQKRCDTCAFTPGSDANREPKNLITAKLAALTPFPFYCHEAIDWKAERSGGRTRAEFVAMKAGGFHVCQGWRDEVAGLHKAGYYADGNAEARKGFGLAAYEFFTNWLTTKDDDEFKAESFRGFRTLFTTMIDRARKATAGKFKFEL